MPADTETAELPSGSSPSGRICWWGLLFLLCGVTLLSRLIIRTSPDLWIDETWTGGIVYGNSFAELFYQIYHDVNAPLFYLVEAGFVRVFGYNLVSLRAPAFLFSILTPFVPFMFRQRDERAGSLVLVLLLAVWASGIGFAQDARSYSLLLLISTAQTLMFVRLVRTGTLAVAFQWAGLGCLAVLTHYYAGILVVAQALVYLALRWRTAPRLWPAGLAFAPAALWVIYHAPQVALYSTADVAWYKPLGLSSFIGMAKFLAGGPTALLLLTPVIAVCARILLVRMRNNQPLLSLPSEAYVGWLAILCSAAIFLGIVVSVSFARPLLTDRYLTPVSPSLLYGLAMAPGLLLSGRTRLAIGAAMVLAVASGTAHAVVRSLASPPDRVSLEAVGRRLAHEDVSRVTFLYDVDSTPVVEDRQLSALIRFTLRQDPTPPQEINILRPSPEGEVRQWPIAQTGEAIVAFGSSSHTALSDPAMIAPLRSGWRCERDAEGHWIWYCIGTPND